MTGLTVTEHYPVIGDIVITQYTQNALDMQDTCSSYQVVGSTCEPSDVECNSVQCAKAFEKDAQDGTCGSVGYTVEGSPVTKHHPVSGDSVVTQYTKPALDAQDSGAVDQAPGSTRGQSDLDCKCVHSAKEAEKGAQDGTCSSAGRAEKGSTVTGLYPVIGDILVTQCIKPALEV